MNKTKYIYKLLLFLLLVLIISGCSYKAYMGIHGSSIKLHPDTHIDVTEDKQCLDWPSSRYCGRAGNPTPWFQGLYKMP